MKRRLLLLASLIGFSSLAANAEDGFVPLFDGKTMAGWKNVYT